MCDRGEPLKARAVLETALAEKPSDDSLRLVYGTVLLQAADWENGLQQLELVRARAAWSPLVEAS